jgi:hypothetical protein
MSLRKRLQSSGLLVRPHQWTLRLLSLKLRHKSTRYTYATRYSLYALKLQLKRELHDHEQNLVEFIGCSGAGSRRNVCKASFFGAGSRLCLFFFLGIMVHDERDKGISAIFKFRIHCTPLLLEIVAIPHTSKNYKE